MDQMSRSTGGAAMGGPSALLSGSTVLMRRSPWAHRGPAVASEVAVAALQAIREHDVVT